MRKLFLVLSLFMGLILIVPGVCLAQAPSSLLACKDCAYSTEEDFLTQGPEPADGNPLISDGDLLSCSGVVCMRNAELLQPFDVTDDLGLDAVDILDVETGLVAFSTELNSPHGNFYHGDLLTTSGAVIPNKALLLPFQVYGDRGLDGVHFVGEPEKIVSFFEYADTISRAEWLRDPGLLAVSLREHGIDIWFSIEGSELTASAVPILDGDLLSVVNGVIARQNQLLPNDVPAGITQRGIDFGLDAVSAPRDGLLQDLCFSTEILYSGRTAFTDGDIVLVGNGVIVADKNLYAPFEPKADFLGTDAYYLRQHYVRQVNDFLALVLRLSRSWPLQGASSSGLGPRIGRIGR